MRADSKWSARAGSRRHRAAYLGALGDLFDGGAMPEMGGEILRGTAEDVEQKGDRGGDGPSEGGR